MSVLNRMGRLPTLQSPYVKPFSVRFNHPDFPGMHRTFALGNRKKFYIGMAGKIGNVGNQAVVGADRIIMSAGGIAGTQCIFGFDRLHPYKLIYYDLAISASFIAVSQAVFNDPSADVLLEMFVDTDNADADRRVILRADTLELVKSISTNPTLSQNTTFNTATRHEVGRDVNSGTTSWDGEAMAMVFIDGAHPADGDLWTYSNGVWKPKTPKTPWAAGNTFYMDFWPAKYGEAVSLTNVCKDRSGNGNNFTGVNIDVTTSGQANDYLKDSMTSLNDKSNYCVLSSIDCSTPADLLDALMTYSPAAVDTAARGTLYVDQGKYYFEVKVGNAGGAGMAVGFAENIASMTVGNPHLQTGVCCYQGNNGNKDLDGVSAAYGAALVNGDVLQVALDLTAGKIWWGINGTYVAAGNPATGANAAFTSLAGRTVAPFITNTSGAGISYMNFGQQAFAFTPPSGFSPINTAYLRRPSVAIASKGFVAKRGLGSAIQAALSAYQFGWAAYVNIFKNVSNAQDWKVQFSDDPTQMLAFNTTAAKALLTVPTAGDTYVGYSINLSAANGGFTALVNHVNGVADTVAHGLGVSPFTTVKRTDAASAWLTWHPSLTAGRLLYLNTTDAQTVDAGITVDATNVVLAAALASGIYRVLCMATKSGLVTTAKYTGNGSLIGPTVWAAQCPALTILKDITSAGQNWIVTDAPSNPHNTDTAQKYTSTNLGTAETSDVNELDRLSTGVKLRTTSSVWNQASDVYVTLHLAEADVTYARAV